MQDRFRFRVWWQPDYEEPQMLYDAEQTYDFIGNIPAESFGEVLEDKKFIVMQCTGLKDKNGKLIYENDFVKNFDNRVYQVIWINDAACFMVENIITKTKQGIYSLISLKNDLEVIGNIYENKELLNEN